MKIVRYLMLLAMPFSMIVAEKYVGDHIDQESDKTYVAPLYVFDAKKHAENFWLSNYYPASVTLNIGGKNYTFASGRAAFEAGFFAPPYAKEVNVEKVEALAKAPDAYYAADIGEKNPCPECYTFKAGKRPIVVDWMKKVVKAKFDQHEDLKARLIATGDAEIIEDCEDMFWGASKGGQNWFGRILMEIRKDYQKQQEKGSKTSRRSKKK